MHKFCAHLLNIIESERKIMSQFNVENLKNPEFYQDNRLQAHSDHVIYKDEYECLAKKTS